MSTINVCGIVWHLFETNKPENVLTLRLPNTGHFQWLTGDLSRVAPLTLHPVNLGYLAKLIILAPGHLVILYTKYILECAACYSSDLGILIFTCSSLH